MTSVAFSPDGKQVLGSTARKYKKGKKGPEKIETGKVFAWDAVTGEPVAPPAEFSAKAPRMVTSPDGRLHARAEGSRVVVERLPAEQQPK